MPGTEVDWFILILWCYNFQTRLWRANLPSRVGFFNLLFADWRWQCQILWSAASSTLPLQWFMHWVYFLLQIFACVSPLLFFFFFSSSTKSIPTLVMRFLAIKCSAVKKEENKIQLCSVSRGVGSFLFSSRVKVSNPRTQIWIYQGWAFPSPLLHPMLLFKP